jgi:hypothetical protein
MGLFDFVGELQDEQVIKNWPCQWISLVIESEDARGSVDPFPICAADLAAQAKKLAFPVALIAGKGIPWGDKRWNGRIEAAWPAVKSVEDMQAALFTWEMLHSRHKLGSVTLSASLHAPLAFWGGKDKKVWRSNFKLKPS